MNKQQLVDEVSAKVGITKVQTNEIIKAMIETVTTALNNGDRVTLVGFGTFHTAQRKARKGRNPQNGAEILISSKKIAKFKPGGALSNSVNNGNVNTH